MNWFGLKEFANKWNFERRYIHSGKNKVKMNAYEDLKSEDVQWYNINRCYKYRVQKILDARQEDFRD